MHPMLQNLVQQFVEESLPVTYEHLNSVNHEVLKIRVPRKTYDGVNSTHSPSASFCSQPCSGRLDSTEYGIYDNCRPSELSTAPKT